MRIEEALQYGKKELSALDAELLLGFVLNKNREFLITHASDPVSEELFSQFQQLMGKRKNGVPLAHITGEKEFFGRTFLVSPECLIPRPETEELCELAMAEITRIKAKKVVDVGTGSSCIAITLTLESPEISVIGTDFSASALEIAKKNGEKFQAQVDFREGDLLEPISESIDFVVANLPYIPDSAILPRETTSEPAEALFSGSDGLAHYRKLWKQMGERNIRNGIFEIDRSHAKKAQSEAEKLISKSTIEILPDLTGLPRFLRVRPKG